MAGLTIGMSGYVRIPYEYVHFVSELVIVSLLGASSLTTIDVSLQ